MKIKSIFFLLMVLIVFSCKNSHPTKHETSLDTTTLGDIPAEKDSVIPIKNTVSSSIKTVQKPLQAISTLEFINYYDKLNGISLKYPKNWYKENNKYVPFKITSPQEGETDSMKENFYYAVIDETPNQNDLLNKNANPVLSLNQMNEQLCKDLIIERKNRINNKIESNRKIMINGIEAYEIVSIGTINGYKMKYRICLIKKGSKQYYLYFATEQYTYDRYKEYADLLFSTFYIK